MRFLLLNLLLLTSCAHHVDTIQGLNYIKDFNKSHIPITFMLDQSLTDKFYQGPLERAEVFYTDFVDVELTNKSNTFIVPILDVTNYPDIEQFMNERDWYGVAAIDKKNEKLTPIKIYINTNKLVFASFSTKWRVFAHEMGHCFGLAHDVEQGSIMYSAIPSIVNEYLGISTLEPYLSEEDRVFLKKTYE